MCTIRSRLQRKYFSGVISGDPSIRSGHSGGVIMATITNYFRKGSLASTEDQPRGSMAETKKRNVSRFLLMLLTVSMRRKTKKGIEVAWNLPERTFPKVQTMVFDEKLQILLEQVSQLWEKSSWSKGYIKIPYDGTIQPRLQIYPRVFEAGKYRSFCTEWFESNPWMEYPQATDNVYCFFRK